MTTRMSTAEILAMADKGFGDSKKQLLNRARYMENNSPEPRHTINMWDMNLAMKEKERLGINFNRSVTMSLESRWEVVNKLTVEFLKEVISLNDQLSEEAAKQARQLLTLILTRTKRLGMVSKMEQMAGLLMHITFYRTVLKAKMEETQESRSFLLHCSELMGFSHQTQIMDRYTALTFTLNEIREEFDLRASHLSQLQEMHNEYVESKQEENIVLHNRMARMHVRLKELRKDIADMERFLDDREQQAADTLIQIKKIKFSINHCYTSMMTYKGLESRETNPVKQMDEFGIRLSITLAALRYLEDLQRRSRSDSETSEVVRRTVRLSQVGPEDSLGSAPGGQDQVDFHFSDSSLDSLTSGKWNDANWNKSSANWRPCQQHQQQQQQPWRCRIAGAAGHMSRTSNEAVRERDGWASFSRGDPPSDSSTRCILSTDSPAVSGDGELQAKALTERIKHGVEGQAVDSAGAAEVSDPQKRGLKVGIFPHSRSFPGGEIEAVKRTKSRALDTIDELISPRAMRASSHSVGVMPQIPSLNQRTCDGEASVRYGFDNVSQRVLCPPLRALNGGLSSASLDKSSNKSVTSCIAPTCKTGDFRGLEHRSKAVDFLPSIRNSSAGQWKKPVSARSVEHRSPMSESGASLTSVLRLSERTRRQMNSKERLYYLARAAAEESSKIKHKGFWDHGVFEPSPRGNNKKSKLTTSKKATLAKEKAEGKGQTPSSEQEGKEKKEVTNARASTYRRSLSPPLKAAVKRQTSLSDILLMRQIDLLQGTVTSGGDEERCAQESSRPENRPAVSRLSLGSSSGRLPRQPSSSRNRKSESSLKSPARKLSTAGNSSSEKILEKSRSAPAKSYRPPLRRTDLLQQQWRYTGSMAPAMSSATLVQTAPSSAQKANARKLARKLYQTRHLKKECLSILANVRLGSRWSDRQLDES